MQEKKKEREEERNLIAVWPWLLPGARMTWVSGPLLPTSWGLHSLFSWLEGCLGFLGGVGVVFLFPLPKPSLQVQ